MLQEIWAKTNPRERLCAIGAGLILLSWILGLVLSGGYFGAGSNTLGLLGAIVVLAMLYLRYAPNTNVTWPAPYPVILLAVAAVVGVVALLQLLQALQYLGSILSYLPVTYWLLLILYFGGSAVMAWGAYQEWNLSKSTAS